MSRLRKPGKQTKRQKHPWCHFSEVNGLTTRINLRLAISVRRVDKVLHETRTGLPEPNTPKLRNRFLGSWKLLSAGFLFSLTLLRAVQGLSLAMEKAIISTKLFLYEQMVTLSLKFSSPGHIQQAFTLKFHQEDCTDVEQSGFKQAQSKQGMCLNWAGSND